MDMPDQTLLLRALREQGIMPISIREKVAARQISITIPGLTGRVSSRDVMIFSRQFSTMINAGLPLVQCLEILAEQTDNKTFAGILTQIKKAVEGGSPLADALSKHPKIFSELFTSMVEAGETGGILDVILNRLATYMEKSEALKRKIKGAMFYPATIFSIAIILTSVIILFVIPTFKNMFADFGATLPLPTQILLSVSEWVKKWILLLFLGMIGLVIGLVMYCRSPQGKEVLDKFLLKLPLFGTLVRKVSVAKFTRTLGTLISSGVPILDALRITAKSAGNKVVENAIMKTQSSIQEGQSIATPLKNSGVFPPMVVQMINVGEHTGALDEMLGKIADFYEADVDSAVGSLTTLIEPLLLIFLGVVIGGIVIALFLPILTLGTQIR
jgi:type IV pilus assembly protein PilC